MKKVITLIAILMLMVSMTSCNKDKPVETVVSAGEETIVTETIIEETIIEENIETEDVESEVWISEEYLREVEFNSQRNQW